jgi:hypothetical protein
MPLPTAKLQNIAGRPTQQEFKVNLTRNYYIIVLGDNTWKQTTGFHPSPFFWFLVLFKNHHQHIIT